MDTFTDQKCLVVGGAGFVGSNLVQALLSSAPREVVIIDNFLSAERANVLTVPEVTLIEGSITDDAILADLPDDFDYVFHLATYHGNQSSIHNPLADHEHNTLTTLKLYERLKSASNLKKVVYASAGCTMAEKTFDTPQATTEDAPVSLYLDSPYQISKLIGELYSNYYFTQHHLPVVKARFQNVYGPREILGAGQWRGTPATIWRNVVPTFVYKALQGMPLPVENHGVATRDFIYVEDICRGLIACALRGGPGEAYNLASGTATSILALAHLINETVGNQAGVEYLPKRDWDHSGQRFGSTIKAEREMGFCATTPLREGITKTVTWAHEHRALIQGCMQKHQPYLLAITHEKRSL